VIRPGKPLPEGFGQGAQFPQPLVVARVPVGGKPAPQLVQGGLALLCAFFKAAMTSFRCLMTKRVRKMPRPPRTPAIPAKMPIPD
jgi:hypothetical protein